MVRASLQTRLVGSQTQPSNSLSPIGSREREPNSNSNSNSDSNQTRMCVSLTNTLITLTLTNSRTSYLKKRTRNQKEKYGTFPLLIIPVYVFQTAFSLINWGKWLRTSSPGPVPYCPFPFSFPHPPLFPVPTVLDSPYSPTCSLSTMFYVVNSRTLDSTLPPRYCYC